AATATEELFSSASSRASLAVAVVLPEPCRPAIRITVGGREEKASPAEAPPISSVSSSPTIFTTCWPGLSLPTTSSPRQRSLSCEVNWRTTLKLTSASSRARRISRIAASMSCSESVPRWRTSPSVACSFSESESNIRALILAARGAAPAAPRAARDAAWLQLGLLGARRLHRPRPARRRFLLRDAGAVAQRLADATEGLGELGGHHEHLVGLAFGELREHLQVFVAEQFGVRL